MLNILNILIFNTAVSMESSATESTRSTFTSGSDFAIVPLELHVEESSATESTSSIFTSGTDLPEVPPELHMEESSANGSPAGQGAGENSISGGVHMDQHPQVRLHLGETEQASDHLIVGADANNQQVGRFRSLINDIFNNSESTPNLESIRERLLKVKAALLTPGNTDRLSAQSSSLRGTASSVDLPTLPAVLAESPSTQDSTTEDSEPLRVRETMPSTDVKVTNLGQVLKIEEDLTANCHGMHTCSKDGLPAAPQSGFISAKRSGQETGFALLFQVSELLLELSLLQNELDDTKTDMRFIDQLNRLIASTQRLDYLRIQQSGELLNQALEQAQAKLSQIKEENRNLQEGPLKILQEKEKRLLATQQLSFCHRERLWCQYSKLRNQQLMTDLTKKIKVIDTDILQLNKKILEVQLEQRKINDQAIFEQQYAERAVLELELDISTALIAQDNLDQAIREQDVFKKTKGPVSRFSKRIPIKLWAGFKQDRINAPENLAKRQKKCEIQSKLPDLLQNLIIQEENSLTNIQLRIHWTPEQNSRIVNRLSSISTLIDLLNEFIEIEQSKLKKMEQKHGNPSRNDISQWAPSNQVSPRTGIPIERKPLSYAVNEFSPLFPR